MKKVIAILALILVVVSLIRLANGYTDFNIAIIKQSFEFDVSQAVDIRQVFSGLVNDFREVPEKPNWESYNRVDIDPILDNENTTGWQRFQARIYQLLLDYLNFIKTNNNNTTTFFAFLGEWLKYIVQMVFESGISLVRVLVYMFSLLKQVFFGAFNMLGFV